MSGIFIKNIIAESSADKCGLLKVGDRILGNNTFSLEGRLYFPFVLKYFNNKVSLSLFVDW